MRIKPKPKVKLFQARIDAVLLRKVRVKLKKQKLTWRQFIEAAIMEYIK